jgi:hypothetical protein
MANVLVVRGTAQTLLSTELNSLANNANAVHASSVTISSAGFLRCELELLVTFGTAPTANTTVNVWLLHELDGSNFEDGSGSITPLRVPDAFFALRAVTTAQRIIFVAELPPGTTIRPLLRNDGTGQAMASSGNTLKIRPLTESI